MTYLERVFDMLGVSVLGILASISVASILGRYLFSLPVPDSYDLTRMLHGIVIALGISLATRHRSHIQVDLIIRILPDGGRKLITVASDIVIAMVILTLCRRLWAGLILHMQSGEVTMMLGLPLWPFMALIGGGIAIACVQAIRNVCQSISAAVSNDEVAR